MKRRTKIVATIGPACQDSDMIRNLLKAGVNIARLNMSHGTQEEHASVFHKLRSISKELQDPVCILIDLQGPKIRIGKLLLGEIFLEKDQTVSLTTQRKNVGVNDIPVDFPELPRCLHPGERILIDDGRIELQVERIASERVAARVLVGGLLKSHKGINLPAARLNIPALTEKDVQDLEFGLNLGVDAIALSYVRSKEDVRLLRDQIHAIAPYQSGIPIIAKIERPQALEQLEDIIAISDGVMVARGDLGVEMTPQEVPIAQKRVIERANRHGKTVITATQMLETMIHNPRPTRAEASDVANAIFDGTDAVMLSGETAVGDYPIQSVELMDAIICQAENHLDEWGRWDGSDRSSIDNDDTKFMSLAVRELAHDRNVAAIVVFTMSGRTALNVSKTRPNVPILAFTPEINTYHRLELFWGVTPYLVSRSTTLEELIEDVNKVLKDSSAIDSGQQVVLTCGFPVATMNPTNLLLLHTIS